MVRLLCPLVAAAVSLVLGLSMALAQPHLCTDEVFPPLAAGYAALQAGATDQARVEFEKVIGIDAFNPYALNNLAVLAERQGKLTEAMDYLLTAETYANSYCHRLAEVCEGGGLCLAILPSSDQGPGSSIAAIIHANIQLLKTKISQTGRSGP